MKHILCIVSALIMVIIAMYFGASVHGAKTGDLIRHLNEMDQIYNYDVALIPRLNYRGGIFTMPFILIISVVEVLIFMKTNIRQVKNIALGLLFAILIVLIIAVLTILYPYDFDISKWGYVWITMGMFIVAGNALSLFIKGK